MPRDDHRPRGAHRLPRAALTATAALLALLAAPAAQAHDYPTLDRVRFVQECMREHPGSPYEMTNKCVCAIDRIAEQLPYDDFVSGWTAANAISIGGERGSYIRDTEVLQVEIKRYRALVAESKKACFIR
ncbi:hypothetical protein ABXN37_01920 [Piscinibacter sakaiensis]|uniref:Lysozyme inhibitor LprI N-terminal domain-containing protein n=1 Tax=Piscinibacter sakaiensis TaxID=1547922 RepID=A0A0K8NVG5_PISS1|nr:hypothetical protein [Piscinibacter sakaiensis]GAP33930.1 hypothetical protein ISF6_1708 [Piscinibacter sakaiensis]